jgi:N-acetylglucosaminyltransferase
MELFLIWSLRLVFVVYLTLVVLHSTSRWRYARRSAKRSQHRKPKDRSGTEPSPSVDVIIPCYNEDPGLLAGCFASLARQDYTGRLRVWVVDDGSSNRHALQPVYQAGEDRGWTVLRLDRNRGKRLAQEEVIGLGDGEFVVLMDSDTQLARDGIRRIMSRCADQQAAAVAANVSVLNERTNLLTRLLRWRYHLLSEHERAAQGSFNSVLCCPGPFSVYRRAELMEVWPTYLEHQFTAGDDLHLTILLLRDGHDVVYEPSARAFTKVPDDLPKYLRQQLRWNRSFYREVWPAFGSLWERHPYLALDIMARAGLPLLLGATLIISMGEAVVAGTDLFMHDLRLVGAMLGVNALAVMLGTRNAWSALLYRPLHLMLIPIKVYALMTLHRDRWETR